MHSRSGGNIEVMGLMQGKVQGDTMYVMDAFALPVEGTETRVNAQNEAYEYMVTYMEQAKQVGRQENVIGWYHSHPGYGCWLSGIDVGTQSLNQQYQEPFVAVVVSILFGGGPEEKSDTLCFLWPARGAGERDKSEMGIGGSWFGTVSHFYWHCLSFTP